uniref:hypothetical protein n=1 Tax=Escherichia coli TaxID=562 RepID=UPI001BED1858
MLADTVSQLNAWAGPKLRPADKAVTPMPSRTTVDIKVSRKERGLATAQATHMGTSKPVVVDSVSTTGNQLEDTTAE